MKLCGLQKTTLLDFPGHVAATVFLGGCNFRCPFCQNSSLLSGEAQALFSEEDFLSFLRKRKGILEGVCITGGEPTLNPDLEDFILKIRSLGFLIKLDTNGYQPKVLKNLVNKGIIDYVAMDIKAGRAHYQNAAGLDHMDITRIEESVSFLMEETIPFEFRTTAVKGIHEKTDFEDMGKWLCGSSHYYIQNYVDSDEVLCSGYNSFSIEELKGFLAVIKPYIPSAALRGID